jgi:hypothetical protein
MGIWSLPTLDTTIFQFANDTAIITSMNAKNIKIIMSVLRIFIETYGLQMNLSKIGFLQVSIPVALLPPIQTILRCHQLSLPIQYLRLPLTIHKPPRDAYLTLIAEVQRRYEGWSNGHLSIVGRSVLTDVVLNALLLTHASIPPARLGPQSHSKIHKKKYLWQGAASSFLGAHCLLSWQVVMLSKRNGGLSITNLQL